jgi:Flp pilus assembly pilin Flp
MMLGEVRSRAVDGDDAGAGAPSKAWRARAQALAEYALILALVAMVAVAGLLVFRPSITNTLSNLSGSV